MLLLVTCTSALLRTRFLTCMDVHLKRFRGHGISKNYNLWRTGTQRKFLFTWEICQTAFFFLLFIFGDIFLGAHNVWTLPLSVWIRPWFPTNFSPTRHIPDGHQRGWHLPNQTNSQQALLQWIFTSRTFPRPDTSQMDTSPTGHIFFQFFIRLQHISNL